MTLFMLLVFSFQDGNFPVTNGSFYAISVSDLDQAVDWYSKHLGFKVVSKGGNAERSGALLVRDGATLELASFKQAQSLEALQAGLESYHIYGIFKIGFSTDHLDQTYQALKSQGVEIFFEIVEGANGLRMFGIKDLDGNIIQFVGP